MPKIVINDLNYTQFIGPHTVDGEKKGYGLIPRNFARFPVGYQEAAKPFDLPLIPESEWPDRIKAMQDAKATMRDIRDRGMNGQRIPSRDQGNKGYCWAHSSTSACLIVRAINNQPYADLSAYAVACIIKNYRDQGGWGAESLEWIAANGIPTSEFWPQQSMSRSNDNPAMRANAALHKVTEWMDLDPNNMKAQFYTCLLSGIPVVADYNWWSHSVLAIEALTPTSGNIWNSWGDAWSENGIGELQGNKWIPDGAIAPRVMIDSDV